MRRDVEVEIRTGLADDLREAPSGADGDGGFGHWPPEPDEKGDLERNIIAGIAAHQAAPSPSAIAARSKDTRVDIKDFKQSNARPNTMP
jgi:hypothetical protein